jgi:hypothetical protein
MRQVGIIALGAALAGCTLAGCTLGQAPSQMSWMRHDGTPVDAGFHFVLAQCREVAEKVGKASPVSQREDLKNTAMHGCMAQHGYYWRCPHAFASLYDGACLKLEGIAPAIVMPEGIDDAKPVKPAKRPTRRPG